MGVPHTQPALGQRDQLSHPSWEGGNLQSTRRPATSKSGAAPTRSVAGEAQGTRPSCPSRPGQAQPLTDFYRPKGQSHGEAEGALGPLLQEAGRFHTRQQAQHLGAPSRGPPPQGPLLEPVTCWTACPSVLSMGPAAHILLSGQRAWGPGAMMSPPVLSSCGRSQPGGGAGEGRLQPSADHWVPTGELSRALWLRGCRGGWCSRAAWPGCWAATGP